jgi:hypothetical protein
MLVLLHFNIIVTMNDLFLKTSMSVVLTTIKTLEVESYLLESSFQSFR